MCGSESATALDWEWFIENEQNNDIHFDSRSGPDAPRGPDGPRFFFGPNARPGTIELTLKDPSENEYPVYALYKGSAGQGGCTSCGGGGDQAGGAMLNSALMWFSLGKTQDGGDAGNIWFEEPEWESGET